MTTPVRVTAPAGLQCPGCGTPVIGVELRVEQTPVGGYGLLLEACGHVVTMEMLRDAWGIDLPDVPDLTRVTRPDMP